MAKKQDTISIGFEENLEGLRHSEGQPERFAIRGRGARTHLSEIHQRPLRTEVLQELQGDEYADPEDKDEYTAENIFFVLAEARWSKISAAAHLPEIGVVIDDALTAIERENERLKGILPKNFRPSEPTSAAWVMWWISLRI